MQDLRSPNKKMYDLALTQIGQKEISGSKHNPKIVEYHQATSLHATSDEVPWCASFINWLAKSVGIKGTGSAMARSWIHWGNKVEPSEMQVGDVVVFARGSDGASGHVALVAEVPNRLNPTIKVLGGNQSNQVCISRYPRARVLGYRRA